MHSNNNLSFQDLRILFSRYKVLALSLFMISFFLGIIYTILSPTKYNYSQIIRPAAYVNVQGIRRTFEMSNALLSEINTTYLTTASNQLSGIQAKNNIRISLSGDGVSILLNGTGKSDLKNFYQQYFSKILEQINEGEKTSLDAYRNLYSLRLASLENQLAALNNLQKTTAAFPADLKGGALLFADPAVMRIHLKSEIALMKFYLNNAKPSNFETPTIFQQEIGLSKIKKLIVSLLLSIIISLGGVILVIYFKNTSKSSATDNSL